MRGRPALHVVVPLVSEEQLTDAQPEMGVCALDPAMAYRRYAAYVAAVAHRLLGRDEEVDDTVQEVFLAAIRGLNSLRDPAAVKGWLARITVRVVHRRLRMRRIRVLFGMDQTDDKSQLVDVSASPEQRALLAAIYQVLDRLPAAQRIAWVLRHVEGERLEDVASLAGCSLATAKRRILAAETQLEEAFG